MVADNLGAHSIAGFVENFSGSYVCRFCTAERSELQTNEVRSGTFTFRTKDIRAEHCRILEKNELASYCGVKSILSKRLSYFDVTTGFPGYSARSFRKEFFLLNLHFVSVYLSKKSVK